LPAATPAKFWCIEIEGELYNIQVTDLLERLVAKPGLLLAVPGFITPIIPSFGGMYYA